MPAAVPSSPATTLFHRARPKIEIQSVPKSYPKPSYRKTSSVAFDFGVGDEHVLRKMEQYGHQVVFCQYGIPCSAKCIVKKFLSGPYVSSYMHWIWKIIIESLVWSKIYYSQFTQKSMCGSVQYRLKYVLDAHNLFHTMTHHYAAIEWTKIHYEFTFLCEIHLDWVRRENIQKSLHHIMRPHHSINIGRTDIPVTPRIETTKGERKNKIR